MEIVAQRIAASAPLRGFVELVLQQLLLGQLVLLGRRTEAAQQGEDGQRDDGKNRDLWRGNRPGSR